MRSVNYFGLNIGYVSHLNGDVCPSKIAILFYMYNFFFIHPTYIQHHAIFSLVYNLGAREYSPLWKKVLPPVNLKSVKFYLCGIFSVEQANCKPIKSKPKQWYVTNNIAPERALVKIRFGCLGILPLNKDCGGLDQFRPLTQFYLFATYKIDRVLAFVETSNNELAGKVDPPLRKENRPLKGFSTLSIFTVCFLVKWPQTKCKVTFDTCFWYSFLCSFTR